MCTLHVTTTDPKEKKHWTARLILCAWNTLPSSIKKGMITLNLLGIYKDQKSRCLQTWLSQGNCTRITYFTKHHYLGWEKAGYCNIFNMLSLLKLTETSIPPNPPLWSVFSKCPICHCLCLHSYVSAGNNCIATPPAIYSLGSLLKSKRKREENLDVFCVNCFLVYITFPSQLRFWRRSQAFPPTPFHLIILAWSHNSIFKTFY